VVVTGDGHPVTAPREPDTQLQHQPHTATTTRLAADVVMD
jgi:hypothetical protein